MQKDVKMTDDVVFPLVGKRINTATEEEGRRRIRLIIKCVRRSFRDRVSIQAKWDQRKRDRLENELRNFGRARHLRKM